MVNIRLPLGFNSTNTAPLLLSIFPSFAVGGAQSRFATLVNYLGASWRHVIIALDGDTSARERMAPGLDASFPTPNARKGDLVGNLRTYRAILRTFKPAVMLTHNFGSIEWAIANRFNTVRHLHVEDGFGPEELSRQLPRRVWLRRIFLRHRTVILPSLTLLRIARDTWQLDEKRLHYVPNGVDLTRFVETVPGRRTSSSDGPIVGTVAALRPEKNVARLIHAFHLATSHDPARLVIVGDGPERTALEALVKDLGITARVHFAGHIPKPEGLIKEFDIFAMSSDTEQMPISLLEAMAIGLPVAATDVGDIKSMLPSIARDFITASDHISLASALTKLIRDPLLRVEYGQACRLKAEENFDQNSMFSRWGSLLEAESALAKER